MRIDKFLKVSRILKRRTVAQEACGEEKVLLNGKAAKPAISVNGGEIICHLPPLQACQALLLRPCRI
jgi:ribosomal 50S subunit-recycling heat shock protein